MHINLRSINRVSVYLLFVFDLHNVFKKKNPTTKQKSKKFLFKSSLDHHNYWHFNSIPIWYIDLNKLTIINWLDHRNYFRLSVSFIKKKIGVGFINAFLLCLIFFFVNLFSSFPTKVFNTPVI